MPGLKGDDGIQGRDGLDGFPGLPGPPVSSHECGTGSLNTSEAKGSDAALNPFCFNEQKSYF